MLQDILWRYGFELKYNDTNWLDTADLGEIKTALDWGMVDGITTNPSLIAKAA